MIKVLALDIYGTVLATEDDDRKLPIRQGLERLFERCKERKIRVVTCSDADLTNLLLDLEKAGIKDKFEDFYRLDTRSDRFPYKDFSIILRGESITAQELFIIGDRDDIDGAGARIVGAEYSLVPEYMDVQNGGDFDLGTIKIP